VTPTRNGSGDSSERPFPRRTIYCFSPSGHIIGIASGESDVDDEPVVPQIQAQPSTSNRKETIIREEASWGDARPKKRARTVDELVEHSDAPLPPARKVQKPSGRSVLPRLPSASRSLVPRATKPSQRFCRPSSTGRSEQTAESKGSLVAL
jgi:hypothetical protein